MAKKPVAAKAEGYEINAWLIRYEKKPKDTVELSVKDKQTGITSCEGLSLKHKKVYLAGVCDTGSETRVGVVLAFQEGKLVAETKADWHVMQPIAQLPKSAKKGEAKEEETVTKVQTVNEVDTQGKEVKMTKPAKKAAAKAEKTAPKKTNRAIAKDEKTKRPAKISGKLEKIEEAKPDKPVAKKTADAIFEGMKLREEGKRTVAARFLCDNMGVAVSAQKLCDKVYGKGEGTMAALRRVIDGINFSIEKAGVKAAVVSLRRDSETHFRLESI